MREDGKSYSIQMKIKKKAEAAILIADKIGFKIRLLKDTKKDTYIMIKESIQEDRTIVEIYALNTVAPQYGETDVTNINE